MKSLKQFGLAVIVASFCFSPMARGQMTSCRDNPAYHRFDFWIGDWEVVDPSDGSQAGTNLVEKVADGCAILETWHDPDGSEVRGLIYYLPATQTWKYVLVSASGIKERILSKESAGGAGASFVGEIPNMRSAGSHLDRMTLYVLPNGRLRETVETSGDQGKTWKMGFDLEYRRKK